MRTNKSYDMKNVYTSKELALILDALLQLRKNNKNNNNLEKEASKLYDEIMADYKEIKEDSYV